jgi:hypothetical protein
MLVQSILSNPAIFRTCSARHTSAAVFDRSRGAGTL